ncbi:hypothetical protein [Desulfomarina sp.]
MVRKKKKMFAAADGTALDVLISSPGTVSRGVILIYPCIGGTTRMYMIPHEELTARGYTVVEFHPRAHGRSEGQMSMARSLKDLYYLLFSTGLSEYPITAVAHSAGCNALLQINLSALHFERVFFVQPVFSFAESMEYMYKTGTDREFLDAVSRWTSDREKLERYLCSERWLEPAVWHRERLRQKINAISVNFRLGDFLEDFYIPGFETINHIYSIRDRLIFYLSTTDRWYPVSTTRRAAETFTIPVVFMEQSEDHFLQGCWDDIWNDILKRI